jgi:hypothetical protein
MIRLASIRPATDTRTGFGFQFGMILSAIRRVQFGRQRIAAEIGGIGVASGALVSISDGAGRSVYFHRSSLSSEGGGILWFSVDMDALILNNF